MKLAHHSSILLINILSDIYMIYKSHTYMKLINFDVLEYLSNLEYPIVIGEQAVNSITGEIIFYFLN
jgi:hypothetical protein